MDPLTPRPAAVDLISKRWSIRLDRAEAVAEGDPNDDWALTVACKTSRIDARLDEILVSPPDRPRH